MCRIFHAYQALRMCQVGLHRETSNILMPGFTIGQLANLSTTLLKLHQLDVAGPLMASSLFLFEPTTQILSCARVLGRYKWWCLGFGTLLTFLAPWFLFWQGIVSEGPGRCPTKPNEPTWTQIQSVDFGFPFVSDVHTVAGTRKGPC